MHIENCKKCGGTRTDRNDNGTAFHDACVDGIIDASTEIKEIESFFCESKEKDCNRSNCFGCI